MMKPSDRPDVQDPAAPGGYRILHTMLHVGNLDASLRFYSDLLGMSVLRERDYGTYKLVFLGYGAERETTVIELRHDWDRHEPVTHGHGFGHIAVAVHDIHGLCDRLRAAGVKVLRDPSPQRSGGAVLTFVEDPDGFVVELIKLDQ